MKASARFLVAGRVQGVFFRASTRAEARRLGIGGYAKNLDDGRVEVVAQGDPDAIEQFARWLRHGPPQARVDALERDEIDTAPMDGFRIA
jgi:acylphosphatase